MSIDNIALENNEPEDEINVTEPAGNETELNNIPVKKPTAIQSFYEYVETFCYALALMILLFMFVFRYVSVEGDSMKNTLHNEDKLVISNLAYKPKTGDIVVIKYSPKPLIKRVIAVGGQKVRIDYENWDVYVDGVKLDKNYINRINGIPMASSANTPTGEFFVEEGKVFVMGDNRNDSLDSRQLGQFKVNDILGRVMFRVYPDFGKVNNNTGKTTDGYSDNYENG
jgi:signal peptidase I